MAEQHQGAPPDEQPPNVFPAPDHRDQQLCLDAGCALLLCGVCMAIPTAFYYADDGCAANRTRAILGFLLWIMGSCLCLLALTPMAPWAVRAGAAVATTVLKCLSPALL